MTEPKNKHARSKAAYAAELLHDAGRYVEAAARQLASAAHEADELDSHAAFRMREIVPVEDATTKDFLGLSDQLIELHYRVREYEARLRYVEREI